jgi:hypothetical protein
MHLPSKVGECFRGRCVGSHRVQPFQLPADIDLSQAQKRHLVRRGYVTFDCTCTMHHEVEIPDAPVLVDPVGREIHSNGGK